jgi:osmotically inducible lipoprotein OsmB
MNILKALVLTVFITSLAACGNTKGDRALSGAGLGAAAGLATGAVIGGSGTTGALIGAGAGALAGAATDEDTINMGKPIWR